MKYLILGHPRSGTGYMAKLFQLNGLDVGHEIMGKNGQSNWQYAIPNDKCFPWTKGVKSDYNWDIIIHVVRDPFTAISSIAFTETPYSNEKSWKQISDQFRNKYLNLPNTNRFDRAVVSYIGWNNLIKIQNPDYLINLETAFNDLQFLNFNKNRKNPVNKRSHKQMSKQFWNQVKPKNLKLLNKLSLKWGYDDLIKKIDKL